jgi:hypothetical protein
VSQARGRVLRGGCSQGSSLIRGCGSLASDYERVRGWRGTGRAIIAPARKLQEPFDTRRTVGFHQGFSDFGLKEATV